MKHKREPSTFLWEEVEQPSAKGGTTMTAKIQWYTEMDEALALGRQTGKPILLDFFNPQ